MDRYLKNAFTKIYQKKAWSGTGTVSGPGSTLEQTQAIRQAIPKLIIDYNIKSIADIPCGDFNWLKEFNLGIPYIGIDIVEALIESNKKYETKNISFNCADISNYIPPKVDLIITRDLLIHLSFSDIFKIIDNVKKSESIYWLLSTYTSTTTNKDTQNIAWRPLNMQLDPFNFTKPLKVINEECTEANSKYKDKSLGLWKIIAEKY